jgi:hypothetical protein
MVKVKFLKSHPSFAYFAGDVGFITAAWAAKLLDEGYILPIPDAVGEVVFTTVASTASETKVIENPLPKDLPGRNKLFAAGFDTLEKIKEAGDSLLDCGISKNIATQIKKYVAKG